MGHQALAADNELESLQETIQELNRELDGSRADTRSLQSQLRRTTADLTAGLEAEQASKKDLNRRFLNLNEDCNDIKVALEGAIADKADALKRCATQCSEQSKVARTEAEQRESIHIVELDKIQSSLDDALGQKGAQEEVFKEKFGGLEEVIEGLRGELLLCGDERNLLRKRLDEEAASKLKADRAAVQANLQRDEAVKKHLLWIEALKTEVLQKQDRATDLASKLQTAEKERVNDRRKLSEVMAQLDKADDDLQIGNKEHHALVQSMKDKQAESASHVEELNRQLNAMTAQGADTIQQLSAAEKETSELRTLSHGLEEELEIRLKDLSAATRNYHDLKAGLSKHRTDFATASDEYERRESNLERCNEDLEREKEQLCTRVKVLECEKSDALAESEDLQARLEATSAEADAVLRTKDAEILLLKEQHNDAARELSEKLAIAEETHIARIQQLEAEKQNLVHDSAEESSTLKREVENVREEAMTQLAKTKESMNAIIEDCHRESNEKEGQLKQDISDLAKENSSLQQLLAKCEYAEKEATTKTGAIKVQYEDELRLHEQELNTLQTSVSIAMKEKQNMQVKLDVAMEEARRLEREVSDVTKQSQQEVELSANALQTVEEKLCSSKRDADAVMNDKINVERALEAKEAEMLQLVESQKENNLENKARIQDMHHIIKDRDDAVDSLEQQVSDIEHERVQERNSLQTEIDSLSIEVGIAKEKLIRERDRTARDVDYLKKKCNELLQQMQEADQRGKQAISSLQKEVERQRNQIDGIEVERDGLWAQLEAKKREKDRITSELIALKDARARRLPRGRERLDKHTTLLPCTSVTSEAVTSPLVSRNAPSRANVTLTSEADCSAADDSISESYGDADMSPERTDNFAEAANWPPAIHDGKVARDQGRPDGRRHEDDVGTLIDQTSSFLARRRRSPNASPHQTVAEKGVRSEIKLPPIRNIE